MGSHQQGEGAEIMNAAEIADARSISSFRIFGHTNQ